MGRQRFERAPAATNVQDFRDKWRGRDADSCRIVGEQEPVVLPERDQVRRAPKMGAVYFFLPAFLFFAYLAFAFAFAIAAGVMNGQPKSLQSSPRACA